MSSRRFKSMLGRGGDGSATSPPASGESSPSEVSPRSGGGGGGGAKAKAFLSSASSRLHKIQDKMQDKMKRSGGGGSSRGAAAAAGGLVCAGCDKAIADAYIEVEKKAFHQNCFCCYSCSISLVDGYLKNAKGNFLCAKCHEKQREYPLCSECRQPITTKGLMIDKKPMHPECFKCSKCKTSIGTGDFVKVQGRPVCLDCGWGTCFACAKIVKHTEHGVTALDKCWHASCFKCCSCGNLLTNHSKFYYKKGHPCCPKCVEQVFSNAKRFSSDADKFALKRTAESVLSSFATLLADPLGEEFFVEFAVREYCIESYLFCLDVQQFRHVAAKDLEFYAKKIWDKYLETDCELAINVDAPTRSSIADLFAGGSFSGSKTMFDGAYNKIYALMEGDTYPRFKDSDLKNQLVLRLAQEVDAIDDRRTDKRVSRAFLIEEPTGNRR